MRAHPGEIEQGKQHGRLVFMKTDKHNAPVNFPYKAILRTKSPAVLASRLVSVCTSRDKNEGPYRALGAS